MMGSPLGLFGYKFRPWCTGTYQGPLQGQPKALIGNKNFLFCGRSLQVYSAAILMPTYFWRFEHSESVWVCAEGWSTSPGMAEFLNNVEPTNLQRIMRTANSSTRITIHICMYIFTWVPDVIRLMVVVVPIFWAWPQSFRHPSLHYKIITCSVDEAEYGSIVRISNNWCDRTCLVCF